MARNDPTQTNEQRAEAAMAALQSNPAYVADWPDGLAESIVDLVTDLLHLASLNGIEPDYVIYMAQTHYDREVADAITKAEGRIEP
jgi:hypothetical protein